MIIRDGKSSTFIFMEGQIFGWMVEKFLSIFSLLSWISFNMGSKYWFACNLNELFSTNTESNLKLIQHYNSHQKKWRKCYYFEFFQGTFALWYHTSCSLWKTHCSTVDAEGKSCFSIVLVCGFELKNTLKRDWRSLWVPLSTRWEVMLYGGAYNTYRWFSGVQWKRLHNSQGFEH